MSDHVQHGANRVAGQSLPTVNLWKAWSGSIFPQIRLDIDTMEFEDAHDDIRQAHWYSRLLEQCGVFFRTQSTLKFNVKDMHEWPVCS